MCVLEARPSAPCYSINKMYNNINYYHDTRVIEITSEANIMPLTSYTVWHWRIVQYHLLFEDNGEIIGCNILHEIHSRFYGCSPECLMHSAEMYATRVEWPFCEMLSRLIHRCSILFIRWWQSRRESSRLSFTACPTQRGIEGRES